MGTSGSHLRADDSGRRGLRGCFEVDRRDLHVTRVAEPGAGPPRDGEVLFEGSG